MYVTWLTEAKTRRRKLHGRERRVFFDNRQLKSPGSSTGTGNRIINPGNDALIWRTIRGSRVLIRVDAHGNATIEVGPRGLKGTSIKPSLAQQGEDRKETGRASQKEPRHTVEQLVALAQGQEGWKDWYERNKAVIDEVMGEDAELFTQILAATSAAATVKSNFTLALRVYRSMYDGQFDVDGFKFDDIERDERGKPKQSQIQAMQTVMDNLERVFAGQEIKGGKLSAYAAALAGDDEAIAIDRHISRLIFGDDDTSSNRGLGEGRLIMRAVADELGWTGAQTQSALWAADQVLGGTDPKDVVSYDTLFAEQEALVREAIEHVQTARRAAGGA